MGNWSLAPGDMALLAGLTGAGRLVTFWRQHSNFPDACDTLSRSCARHVLCWPAFPLVPALGSTDSATDCSALFAGFSDSATTLGSDFPCPCIIGFGSSPSRCGPGRNLASGQTRDLPASSAFLPPVTCSWTPAGRAAPRVAAPLVLHSTIYTVSAPATCQFRGSITHPTQLL